MSYPHDTQAWRALRDLAASFTSGENYGCSGHLMTVLTDLVDRLRANVFVFDLLNSKVEPVAAGVPVVQKSVAALQKRFAALQQQHGIPLDTIVSAELRLEFGSGYTRLPYACTLMLHERNGNRRAGRVEGAWPVDHSTQTQDGQHGQTR